jgi:Bacterial regulatory protein, Fis family
VSHNVEEEQKLVDETVVVYEKHGGNVRATALELGISRSSVRRRISKVGKGKKPFAGGTKDGTEIQTEKLPAKGSIKRFILTSAQNNTFVHKDLLWNLEALAKHYDAEIIVGTYTYNQNNYGKLSVKRGKDKPEEKQLWYDPTVVKYIRDERIQLAPGLVWCGEYNALPTNVNPLAGLESYSGRKSAIFPHAKLAMRSIATMQGEGVKLNYTTGTVTQRNYIQKREGTIAEFHHIYGALLVEVNSNGNWWVRQLNQDEGTNSLQDLDVYVQKGKVTTGVRVESITHGDLHGVFANPEVVEASLNMVDALTPKYQFLHDVMEGAAVNPHQRKHNTNHEKFHTWLRGYHKLDNELVDTSLLLMRYERPFSKTVIVDSNHDDAWIKRWLREYDYRKDPPNSEIFLDLQAHLYEQIRNGVTEEQSRARIANPKMVRDINVLEYALRKFGHYKGGAKFLLSDESFKTCKGKIENGMHGHLGPAGRFGTPENLSKMARKANTAHTHATGIYNGLYVAGTSSKLRWDYTKGPSNWSNSHVVTYANGKRTIVTIYNGKWKA